MAHPESQAERLLSRRDLLREAGLGFGCWALLDLLARETRAERNASPGTNPLAARPAHFPAKARSVIFLFMQGGPSQLDTFDPKPLLNKLHGQKLPESFGNIRLPFTQAKQALLLGSKQTFRRCGQSGIEIADNYPHLQTCADELAVIRSCHHDAFNHGPAQYMMNTGSAQLGRPCLGSWVTYGLGSESENLPALVVMTTTGSIKGGPPTYGHGFLPATYQATTLRNAGAPVLYLRGPEQLRAGGQRQLLDLVQWLNQEHLHRQGDDDELSARIASYELAFRMQSAAPEAVDLSKETPATRDLYGVDDPACRSFASRCLIARRLVERGVRFVQIFSGGAPPDDWDAHENGDATHAAMARLTDKPIAGLIQDLRARGLLESTLLIWGGEFGRTPITDGRTPGAVPGRDHNPYGFTTWLAGGGVRGGQIIGATDELGLRAVHDRVHIHDLHATILKLLGIDHRRLTFLFQGREQRLTDVGGDGEFAERLLTG